jgi:hypothetical protein
MSGSSGGTFKVGGTGSPVESTTEMSLDGGKDSTGASLPVSINSKSDMTIGGGTQPLATEITLHLPDPVRTDSKMDMRSVSEMNMRSVSEMAITRPIETRSDMRLDVQPVVVDMCLTANIGRIPRLCIRRPYDHHLRLRVLGVDVLNLDLTGQRSFIIDDLPRRADVAWGAEQHRPAEGHEPPPGHRREWTGPGPAARRGGAGLRIGLGP